MPQNPFSFARDHVIGFNASGTQQPFWPQVTLVNGSGVESALVPAGTDRSGSAGTVSGQIVAANASRRGLEIQNVGTNNIGINEFGGTAAIGSAGTYTLAPGASVRIRTNRAITAIAATAATPFTATEW